MRHHSPVRASARLREALLSREASRLRAQQSLAQVELPRESRVVSSRAAAFVALEQAPQHQLARQPAQVSASLAPEPERSWRRSKVR